jgi:hypothetical protein
MLYAGLTDALLSAGFVNLVSVDFSDVVLQRMASRPREARLECRSSGVEIDTEMGME